MNSINIELYLTRDEKYIKGRSETVQICCLTGSDIPALSFPGSPFHAWNQFKDNFLKYIFVLQLGPGKLSGKYIQRILRDKKWSRSTKSCETLERLYLNC